MKDEQPLMTADEVLAAVKRSAEAYKPDAVIELTEGEAALFKALDWTFGDTEES